MVTVQISEEVEDALSRGAPVLALETSGIVGGLPYPQNLALAQEVDDAARSGGAVPARIAILDGQVWVGLDESRLKALATSDTAVKAGNRDIARIASTGGTGALTVSGSLPVATRVGIDVLAVAGIGGVHRGAAESFDISADLQQFTKSPILVVCAGVKSILDAPLTLEYLETLGIPVIGYRTDDFPGYVSASSGVPNPAREDDLSVIANTALHHWSLGSSSSVLMTHPIAPNFGVDRDALEAEIQHAQRIVQDAGVTGPDITPRMLRELAQATKGDTSTANRAVLISITELGGRVAREVAEARQKENCNARCVI